MADWYPLLDGLRWKGKLRVFELRDDGAFVEFDAEKTKATPGDPERFIFDRTFLTNKQFKDWTGKDCQEERP